MVTKMRKGRAVVVSSVLLVACGGSSEPSPPAGESSDGSGDSGSSSTSTTGELPPADDTTGTTGVEADVTYHEHLRPLLERSCVGCHQPGNIGPFSMTSYDEVHPLREAIVLAVEEGTMPPWHADSDCREYVGDPSLSPEEIALVRAWVDEGAVEGDPAAYVPPDVTSPSSLSRVDLSLALPEPYEPQLAPDDYRCFLLDWPHEELTYVSGFAAQPDQLHMVHHIIAFAIAPEQVAEYQALDDAEPGAGYTCFGGPGGEIDPTDPTSVGNWLGSWAPGGFAGDFPEGTGIPVEPGSKVVVQVHYNTAVGNLQPDQSAVAFKIDAEVERPAVMLLWADPSWITGGMPIPAGEASVVHSFELDPTLFINFITDVIPQGQPFQIYSAAHHMHTLGVRAQQTIERSDGSQTCLLGVPRWDFNWQQAYRFAQPEVFEPGDHLRLACEWDNAAGDATVNWGDGTSDEMCLGIFYATAL
ncbi:MAG: monooxygenase [Myxococcales bacterium]|nr:monooxygenase [Myxococcales bacterium]